ncbi:class I SAM-dependent methyltransferase [Streptomyces noursei]|uniref:class I SAM-dependent methyltransferase n=2 Tax=Streptomyces noursei TaxID=1971 RepID=UPI0019665E26|nr:class I SAM-dependent methyltransferase [Streptomyces noursei]
MGMDFHSTANRLTYTRRSAGEDWARVMRCLVSPDNARVADVGCGGGVYCTAWLELGAAEVTGIDFSAVMLSAAREHCGRRPGLSFRQGEAYATGLPDSSADIVFQRALIHHLDDLGACFREARRVLAPGGRLVVQDRTVDDVLQPGSAEHVRGYFFEKFPFLVDVERRRRPSGTEVEAAMRAAGFGDVRSVPLAELRREYAGADEVRDDVLARTGRSILHELSDDQLAELADYLTDRLRSVAGIREVDHWTVWVASG